MWDIPPKAPWYAALLLAGIAVLAAVPAALGGCTSPVDMGPLLNDPKVEGTINNGGGTGSGGNQTGDGSGAPSGSQGKDFGLVYNNGSGDTPLANGAAIPGYLAISGNDSVTVKVTAPFDPGTVEWQCNGAVLTAAGGAGGDDGRELTVTAGTAPFGTPKRYTITVFGWEKGVPDSAAFYVSVVN